VCVRDQKGPTTKGRTIQKSKKAGNIDTLSNVRGEKERERVVKCVSYSRSWWGDKGKKGLGRRSGQKLGPLGDRKEGRQKNLLGGVTHQKSQFRMKMEGKRGAKRKLDCGGGGKMGERSLSFVKIVAKRMRLGGCGPAKIRKTKHGNGNARVKAAQCWKGFNSLSEEIEKGASVSGEPD